MRSIPMADRGPRGRRLARVRQVAVLSVVGLLGTLVVSSTSLALGASSTGSDHLPLPVFAGTPMTMPAMVDPTLDAAIAAQGQTTVIVSLNAPTSPTAGAAAAPSLRASDNKASLESLLAALPAGSSQAAHVMPNLDMVSLSVDADGLDALRRSPLVHAVAPNRHYAPQLAAEDNRVRAPYAWSFGTGQNGAGQSVAILDSGVDRLHPFFGGRVTTEACHSSDSRGFFAGPAGTDRVIGLCPSPTPQATYLDEQYGTGSATPCTFTTDCGHGTHVAGIAAGGSGSTSGNGSGMAFGASIISEQIYSEATGPDYCPPGDDPCMLAFDDAIFAAIDDLVSLQAGGAHIASANLSLGYGNWSGAGPCDAEPNQAPYHSAFSSLIAVGIAPVVAAGNDYVDFHNGISFPACDSFAVSVGAIDSVSNGFVAGASPHAAEGIPDFATFSQDSGLTKMVAPGFNVTSSVPGNGYAWAYGTSMAAPMVAGAWAVIKQQHPNWGFDDVLGLLRATGFPIKDSRVGSLNEATPSLDLAAAVNPPTFHSMTPLRIVDTRLGQGVALAKVHGGQTITFSAAGSGVPSSALGIVLNVTAINPSAGGYLTVFPGGMPRPLASNLNLTAGVNQPNLVETKLGPNGGISIFNDNATLDIAVDIAGWYDGGGPSNFGGDFHAVDPVRLLDSRDGTGMAGGTPALLQAGDAGVTTLQVTGGTSPVPAGASAVVVNLTAVSPTKAGYLTAWPTDGTRPTASNLNFEAGVTVPNLAVVKLSANGRISFFHDAGQLDLLADVAGWIDDGTSGSPAGHFVPLESRRLLDSRNGVGMPGGVAARFGTQTINLQVLGRGGVPADGVSAVVLNVTAIQPTGYTYVTVWPAGSSQPLVSNLNPPIGRVTPNLVTVKVGANGKVAINNFGGFVNVIADVAGWYTN